MGIKAIKQKYKIEHIVQKRDNAICIGSGYIHDCIVISFDGKIVKKYKNGNYNDGWSTNPDLKRYQEEIILDEQTGELKKLIDSKDEHGTLFPIFTIEDGVLIETFCEAYDYPNTTIEGSLIYENTFFKTRLEAIEYGKINCLSYIEMIEDRKKELLEEIVKKEEQIKKWKERLANLKAIS